MEGCNLGLEVIPKVGNSFTGQPIHIVLWSNDPICGIYRNQFAFTGKQCIANNKFGNVIEYNQSDINCNLPLDSWALAVVIGLFGAYTIIKRK